MEAIILAGGKGTRLQPVVSDRPKPMALVAGRPFLAILLASLAAKGFRHVVMAVGYKADMIMGHFGSHVAGLQIDYAVEEYPLGTGGALRFALQKTDADHVFVFNGDTFLDLEVDALESCWQQKHASFIVGCKSDDTARYGRLEVKNDCVTGFHEKGISGPGLINAGCYVLPQNALDEFGLGKPFSLETDYLAKAVMKKPFDLFLTKGKFIDIGVPEDYARAQAELIGF